MSNLPISERKTLASLEDASFEDEFFEYDPDEDSDGGRGIMLIDRAFFRAKVEGLTFDEWIGIHRLYYTIRQDQRAVYK